MIAVMDPSYNDAEMSPESWNPKARKAAEKAEWASWSPAQSRTVSGYKGLVTTIGSPIAVEAGLVALRQGGSAADAAIAVALTQITTQLGSVVSFAGVMTALYYHAKEKKIYSLDAGYNSYANETDPMSIPSCNMDSLPAFEKDSSNEAKRGPILHGRKTFVPGFMAGIESLHNSFGKLKFASLFEPAIYYAENGVVLNPWLCGYHEYRRACMERTPEGQEFIRQSGSPTPKKGALFVQTKLASTLKKVARLGSSYMYSGSWGKKFVKTIKREGGKVSYSDMADYKVIWGDARSTTFLDHKVFIQGAPSDSAYHTLTALNIAEHFNFAGRKNYWEDCRVLQDLQRISNATEFAPWLYPELTALLRKKKVVCSAQGQLSKKYAKAVAEVLDQFHTSKPRTKEPRHSDSIVVIDYEGNIVALTHTINTVIWGETGIVVEGIPIPDSAGFQQQRLAATQPGYRVGCEHQNIIALEDGQPIFASAAIGSSLIQETLKVLVQVLAKKQDLASAISAPPLLYSFMLAPTTPAIDRPMALPEGSYSSKFIDQLKALGNEVTLINDYELGGIRGTVVAATLDPESGELRSCQTKGLIAFADAF